MSEHPLAPNGRVSRSFNKGKYMAGVPSQDFDSGEGSSSSSDSESDGDVRTKKCGDAVWFPERQGGLHRPVEGARLFNLGVRPVQLPTWTQKLIALPVFWVICYYFHTTQRQLQLKWHIPGDPGAHVQFTRGISGHWQVYINAACIVFFSIYSLSAYIFHRKILEYVLNPLFIPKTYAASVIISLLMYGIGVVSGFFLRQNWVASAAGLFIYFGFATVGRTVLPSSSGRGQISMGPSKADADVGLSYHVDGGRNQDQARNVKAYLLKGNVKKDGEEGSVLRFARIDPQPKTIGDDSVIVEQGENGYIYRMPCGRANIFRQDCFFTLICAFAIHLPEFVIGSGGYNQCPGLIELIVSMVYIPIGYTCYAVFGFRVGLVCKWSLMVSFVYCFWPMIFLFLGGKGCATLTDLSRGHFLPQIWDREAQTIDWHRGFEHCSKSAFDMGGETLLVASTTIAAWVHIMSNFSFLFGMVSGLARGACRKFREKHAIRVC